MTDNQELNEILSNGSSDSSIKKASYDECMPDSGCVEPKETKLSNVVQWTTDDNRRFIPAAKTCDDLPPGMYDIAHSPNVGYFFEKIPAKTEGLLRFPQSNSDKIVGEIQKFWDREKIFKRFSLIHKRGILLWGPPGSGKSCTIQLIIRDVVQRGGVAINFCNPSMFLDGMRLFRSIQPRTPVVVLMEDIDEILNSFNQSEVLNILDGVELVDKTVFLATTNYPENLGARIVNRPSRFDKRFKIGHPNAETRMIYFEHLFQNHQELKQKYDLDKWVENTDGLSLAHLKELFVAVVILEDDYDEAIETLNSMREKMSSDFDDGYLGFKNSHSDKKMYNSNGRK